MSRNPEFLHQFYDAFGDEANIAVGLCDYISVWIVHQVADSLEKGTEHEDEYMISERELLVNRCV